MIIPPIGGLGGRTVGGSAGPKRCRRGSAAGRAPRKPAAQPVGSEAGGGGSSLRRRADRSDLLARGHPAERRQRRAGARDGHRQGPRGRGRRPSRTPRWRCSSPRRSARRPPKPPRRSSRRRSDRCLPSPSSHPGSRPRGWLIAGGGAIAAILFVYLFLHMVSQPSYSTLASGLDPSQTGKMTSTLSAHGRQLPAPEQRHGDRGAVQPDGRRRASRSPARDCSATPSPASHCSTNRASAKATSSSRSPTSAPCRASSRRRSTASRASPGRRSSSCCPTPRTRSSAKTRAPPRPPCCCPGPAPWTRARCAGSPSSWPRASRACS